MASASERKRNRQPPRLGRASPRARPRRRKAMHYDDDNDSLNPGQQDMNERPSGEMPQRVSPMPMAMNNEGAAPAPRKKARRGFAAMSPEKQKEIASLGGK